MSAVASLDRLLPTYVRTDLTIVRGEGCRVWDADGAEYLDFGGGIAVVSLGHCHPGPLAAARAQLERLEQPAPGRRGATSLARTG